MRHALADVVGRHESLRTRFPVHEGTPQQLVVPAERADFGWQIIDATGWSAGRLEEAIDAAARRPFDLAAEIPLRARLFRVTDDEHVLVTVVHRIAADGWSITPLLADLGVAYASRGAGHAPGWDPLATQYVDYALWQRTQFGDLDNPHSVGAAQLAYWENALAGMPERLQLPTDRPYPSVADNGGATVAVKWPAELQQRLAGVAREHNTTTFAVIQAAVAALLSELSASSEVAMGLPVDGRREPALEELVGAFGNTLVLRVDLTADPTFAELLDEVRERSLDAYEHQDVPFELLVERLKPTRSLAHHPLVQVSLAWQDNQPAKLSLGDLQVTALPVYTQTAPMDLAFSLSDHWTEASEPAGIGAEVAYRTDVFDAASIEALIERLRRVLVAMTVNPARRLSSIDWLDEVEHAHLYGWGNRTVLTRPTPPGVSIPALFAAQVARTPEAVAATSDRRSITYRELDEAANRLSHLLAARARAPVSMWRCSFPGRSKRSCRCWRSSKPGRRTCRSTRRRRRPVSGPCSPMPRRSPRSPPAGWPTGWMGTSCWLLASTTQGIESYPATALPEPAADDIAYLRYTSGAT